MEHNKPPKLFHRFFLWYCHPSLKKYIEGDLLELYDQQYSKKGKRNADLNFVKDVIFLFRPGIIKPYQSSNINQLAMFANYFKVGFRNILKYKSFSFINVFGLALAMSVCMLIIMMLADQKRYDAFHEKKDRIYRILSVREGDKQGYATSPMPMSATLKSDYHVAEQTTLLIPEVGGDAIYDNRYFDMRGYMASPSFFDVFSFELEAGDEKTALKEPYSVVISAGLAKKMFGDENPIGKTFSFSDRGLPFPQRHEGYGAPSTSWGDFTVTGVMDETKYKSHLTFDVLVSMSTRASLVTAKKVNDDSDNWSWYFRCYNFVMLHSDKTEDDLRVALDDIAKRKVAGLKEEHVQGLRFEYQALSDVSIGLRGNDTGERLPDIAYYILSVLAAVIMVSACLNYANLSIARALTRAKEIGVRKVTGANRSSLILQFTSESVITALLALGLGILFLMALRPAFQGLWINKFLRFELPDMPSVYLMFLAFAVMIGVIAGIYPAFYLSRYQPIKALKNLDTLKQGRLSLRKVLSVSQFVISLFFITTSILIFNQFKHYMKFDYGFNSSNVVNIELQGVDHKKLGNELEKVPGVSLVSASDIIPATGRSNGIELKRVNTTEEYTHSHIIIADDHFVKNLGVKIIAGKNLPQGSETSGRFLVVNEAFTKAMGFRHPSEAIGLAVESKWGGGVHEIIGVVEDFRFNLLINRHEIGPLVLQNTDAFMYLSVRLETTDRVAALERIESVWNKVDPSHEIRYEFFDDQLTDTHRGIFDVVSIIGFISFLAIVIACLGLLGMATYIVERKRKEVGIRKVLGAAEMRIVFLLSKDFIKVLAFSVCIGAPLSFFINNFWLQKFPNHVEFGIGTVLIGTSVLIIMGLITIGSQTLRASKANPVEALKSE
jgi:putative ABC transport system permease protein